jgi:type IX secretion system PorP/SprF family membrane protein
MKKYSFVFLTFVLCAFEAFAQDKHFSQFYNTPILLNPAQSGFIDQDFRLQTIYRSQWRQIGSPFKTFGAAADMNIPLTDRQKVGVGLVFYRDQMSDIITNNTVLLSASFIQTLDHAQRHKIAIGFQGGYVNKFIDYSKLYFENQISDYEVNKEISSGESFGRDQIGYASMNSGLAYSFQVNKKLEIHSGVSGFNLLSPKEDFVENTSSGETNNRLKGRLLVMGGAKYQFHPRWFIAPEVLFTTQQRALDINAGTGVGYLLNPDPAQNIVLMGGAWYRWNDAIIGMVGMSYKKTTFMFTYDKIISSLRKIKNSPAVSDRAWVGAYEISIIYKGFLNRALPSKNTIPCGIF